MKCPMSFANHKRLGILFDCDEKCAWMLERATAFEKERVCAIAVLASSGTEPMGFFPVNVIERGAMRNE